MRWILSHFMRPRFCYLWINEFLKESNKFRELSWLLIYSEIFSVTINGFSADYTAQSHRYRQNLNSDFRYRALNSIDYFYPKLLTISYCCHYFCYACCFSVPAQGMFTQSCKANIHFTHYLKKQRSIMKNLFFFLYLLFHEWPVTTYFIVTKHKSFTSTVSHLY